MQRVKWLFLPLLFVIAIHSSLSARSFKYIFFEPAVAEFTVNEEKEIQKSVSNHVKIKLSIDEEQNHPTKPKQPTLSFYRYDTNSDEYLTVSQTDFSPNEEVNGKFNPMTPLLLENDQKIDISKKIPAIKCLVFRRDEPLIVVYHDSQLENKKCIDLTITTNKDKEIIRLRPSDENSTLFVGYINTTTKHLKRCDGKLFVEKGTEIEAYLQEKVETKSRSAVPRVFAFASVEGESLQTTANTPIKDSDIWVSVKASKDVVSLGEFIKYTCVIENRGERDVIQANFNNKLSSGLVYRKGTFTLEDKRLKNVLISKENREITLALDIKSGEEKTFSFVAHVGLDAKKIVQSSSFVAYHDKQSNKSSTSVKIQKDFDDKSLIMGQVTLKNPDEDISLAGVRFYMDNGLFTYSDKYGKFHFENVELGSHVVSIDPLSIAGRFIMKECKATARNMASKTSHFVDTSMAHVQKVSFCLEEDKEIKELQSSLSFSLQEDATEKMPEYTIKIFSDETNIFLWPREGYVPPMPSIKVAFLHKSDETMVLYLNGQEVDMLNYDGFVKSKDKKRIISKYRGVDIIDGDNHLEAKIMKKDGSVIKTIKRKIHLSTSPVKANILTEKSSLIADGKTSPVIAVQLFDMAGYPLREGMVGTFTLEKPYLSQERIASLQKNPLVHNNGKNKYTVSANGIAFIPLQATTTSGEVKIHFPFQNNNEYTKAWLNSVAREWFIVGFAEGTVGYNALKTHLISSSETSIVTDKKISFFAKGKVGADTLLSIAYDSGKRSDLGVLEALDPSSEYTVYADESLQQNEALSSKKLYVKIEKKSFYALFGDFDTGLDTHELSRYSRRVNGVKSEFKAEAFEYNAFISKSDTSFTREELRGDGTSGLYHLKSGAIMIGSEKVTIQVRDRYRDELIVSKKVLNPLLDYNIDYVLGTLYFKEPILSRDSAGNPQYIVVESEVESGGKKRLTFGGRGAIKFFSGKLELGLTTLGEENSEDKIDTLYGFDARIKAGENIIINAEYARSQKSLENNNTAAKAYLIEISRHDNVSESKFYYQVQEDFFGFGQQDSTQYGTKKYGFDSTINYWKNMAIKIALYGDEVLISGESKKVAELFSQYQHGNLFASLGYRYGKSDEESATSQLLSNISKRFFHNKVKLSAAYEHTLGEKSDIFQNRIFAETAYLVNQHIEVFANHEILEGKTLKSNQSRAGVKGRPWSGGTLESAVVNSFENDSPRLFALLGLNQNWQVNKNVTLNGSLEREQTIDGEGEDFTAYALSGNYRKEKWTYNAKAEYRTSQQEDKINLDFGVYTEVTSDLGMAFGVRSHSTKRDDFSSQTTDAKLSLAYRPKGDFLLINRLEYLYERNEKVKVAKAIESLLCVMNVGEHSTISGHYGLKYVQDTIDEEQFSTLIDTVGIEFIYDLTNSIELGINGSLLHAYEDGDMQKSFGAYLGYSLFKNTYVGFGYNFEGYHDSDFDGLRRSEQGAFIKFRVKFDQESLQDVLSIF